MRSRVRIRTVVISRKIELMKNVHRIRNVTRDVDDVNIINIIIVKS